MDRLELVVHGGNGGNGVVSFRHEKFVPLGGPDGGDGGKGGDVYLIADGSVTDLSHINPGRKFRAVSGKNGGKNKRHGANGEDLVIKLPVGTVVLLRDNGEEVPLTDLKQAGQKITAAKGGRGGLGNVHFATSRNQAPRKATKGQPGEEHRIVLDLKLIADVGIIGYPNAGKSTLLTALSAARPKIADYPFTTIEPAFGVVETEKKNFVLVEIPGLIEGAHLGKGLGHEFLRHAERTKIFVHLIDGSSHDPIQNMEKLNAELHLYNPELKKIPQLVAVNKIDLGEVQKRMPDIRRLFSVLEIDVFFISAATRRGLPELVAAIEQMLREVEESPGGDEKPIAVFRPQPRTVRHRTEAN